MTTVERSGDWVLVKWEYVDKPNITNWLGLYSVPEDFKNGSIDTSYKAPLKFQVCTVYFPYLGMYMYIHAVLSFTMYMYNVCAYMYICIYEWTLHMSSQIVHMYIVYMYIYILVYTQTATVMHIHVHLFCRFSLSLSPLCVCV